MAATASAWGKPGAWALDSEENEAELQQQSVNDDTQSKGGDGGGAALSDFPSLATAASTKTKKKKPQTLSLSEFSNYSSAKQVQSASIGLTPEEMVSLPTGPRERTAEELDRSRLGGGFRSYGSSYDRPPRGSSEDSRRRGGFDRDSSREFAPSRADETDDWGASKKFTPGNGFERRERGFLSDSQSRADGSDNWAANKAFVPSDGRRIERRGGFEPNGGGSGADSDNWTKKKEEESRKFGSTGGGAFDSIRERRGSHESMNGSDSEAWGRKREESSGSNGRPKLNLKPRTIPLDEGQQNGNGTPGKAKGLDPFGEARPREEVLKEKGQDWKEIDQKLESLKMEVGKKSLGSRNGGASPEKRTEKSWRRFDVNDDAQQSRAERTVNGSVEEAGDGECRNDVEPCQEEN